MRRFLLFILVFLMCFFSVGCNRGSSDSDDTLLQNGEIPLATFEKYGDYKKFLEDADLPENFVAYDDIAHFGEFESFVCLSDAREGDYSQSFYNLKDDSGQSLGLYVYTKPRETENADIIDNVDSDDLRHISGGASGVYTLFDVDYRYVSGELLSMTWVKNGVEYVLIGDSMLSDYPQNANTVVSKMLDRRLAGTVEY